jgi:hypothetical protein
MCTIITKKRRKGLIGIKLGKQGQEIRDKGQRKTAGQIAGRLLSGKPVLVSSSLFLVLCSCPYPFALGFTSVEALPVSCGVITFPGICILGL